MPYLDKAIIIAANPLKDYIIAPNRTTKELGDVEFHREHLTRHGGVFWDIIPWGDVIYLGSIQKFIRDTFTFLKFRRLNTG
ncbi:MAG: hypothetical protein QXZ70_01810 [Candidatus Bathyarchaeia archaeon]